MTSGGVIALPRRELEWVTPWAKPRFSFGVQLVRARAAANRHAPIFEKTDDGLALPQPWCTGFLTAMRLRFDQWRPLLDLGHIHHGLMLPILLYCNDPFGQPFLGPPREGPETEEFLRTASYNIPLVLPEIRDYWMPQRLKENDRQA